MFNIKYLSHRQKKDIKMDIACILVGISVTVITFLFNKYFIEIYDYWKNKGIPCVEGALPFIGNILPILLFRQSFEDFSKDIYMANRGRSMVGFYKFRRPNLIVRDPELIKKVLISHFKDFHNNVVTVYPELDPLSARSPFFSDDETWRIERGRLSNALMSSKKLKTFCVAIKNVCQKFTKYIEGNSNKSSGLYEVESKDLFARFTGEVAASVGFGAEGDFFINDCGPNSFRQIVAGTFDPSIANYISLSLLFIAPTLNKILRNRFVPKHMDHFFRRVVHEMIILRQKQGIVCNDLLQMMLDNQKKKTGNIDEFGITASVTSFFIDCYEASANTLSFFAYQIATNRHVQDKLRNEVITVLERHNGEMTYESLSEMTYMNQALNESMRLFTVSSFIIMKRCNNRCKLVGNDGIECVVEPGTELIVPMQALHSDPDYWTNPEIYDPDRFSKENKNNRPKTVFIPFGEGPRICVGKRFAVMQLKAAMATLLQSYSIEVSPKTKLPLRLELIGFFEVAEGGLWFQLKPL